MNAFERGEHYYEKGLYEKAYKMFKLSHDTGEEVEDSLNLMGRCQTELKNYQLAIEIFDKALKLSPAWERLLFNKGYVYLKLENYQEALALFNRAIMINPESEDAYYYIGLFYQYTNDYEKAKENYLKSIRACSKSP
jgi:tetratricopeptide (TPR) repeat protein